MSEAAGVKPPLSIDRQIELLARRGLEIPDEAVATQALLDGNYYRLSGFFRQFQVDPRHGDDKFRPGTSLDDVLVARDYDTEISELLLSGMFQIERVIRARFSHFLAMKHGSSAFYLDPIFYMSIMPKLDQHLDSIQREFGRLRSQMVRRYSSGDDYSHVPIWVAVETLSFGTVSRMLQYLEDRAPGRAVAGSMSLRADTFESTVHSLAVLRNTCAHHGQLWHRTLVVQTPILRKEQRDWPKFDPQGLAPAALATMRYLRSIDSHCRRAQAIDEFLRADSPLSGGLFQPRPK